MNQLYYGDCLTIMQKEMNSNSVDLIYLDPPFNSNRAYNAIYKDETGNPLPDAIEAFCDLWTLDEERDRAIRQIPKMMIQKGIDETTVQFWKFWMAALRNTNPKLLAYLSYMVERLVQMKIILKPTGSIYLHCDPTYSHYIKVITDGIFGQENFRNEIVWHYSKWSNATKTFQRNHDIIFFYSNSDTYLFNRQFQISDDKLKKLKIGYQVNRPGGVKQLIVYDQKKAANKIKEGSYDTIVYRDTQDSGVGMHDVWNDINILNSQAKERLGYPTQKPVALMERIIKASSNEGDTVFDPFCGCATTIEAAHKLNRKWIGIDIAIHAIKRIAAIRLDERCGLTEDQDYQITGLPRNVEGADDLWKRDKFHFQKWAVEAVDGFVTSRRSHDGGIDGRLYFPTSDTNDLKSMILEVKGGNRIDINDLRALAGVLDNEESPLAGFIARKPLGKVKRRNFQDFCLTRGYFEVNGKSYPRLQILTIPEILEGKRFDTPLVRGRRESAQVLIQFQQ